ncbi:MAG: hypothetical protein ACOC44_10150 [Promethearchaeia archaeon]
MNGIPEFFKVALLGALNAGKSSFLQYRFFDNSFETTKLILKNLFFTIIQRSIIIGEKEVHMELWEYNQGFSQIKNHTRIFHDLDAILLFFDTSNSRALKQVKNWMKLVNSYAENVPVYLIGTKTDLTPLIKIQKIKTFKNNYNSILGYFLISIRLGFQKQKIYGALMDNLLLARRSIEWDGFFNTHHQFSMEHDSSYAFRAHQFNRRFPEHEPVRNSLIAPSGVEESEDNEFSFPSFFHVPTQEGFTEDSDRLGTLREEMLEELERLRDIMLSGDLHDDPRYEDLDPPEKDIFDKFMDRFEICPLCGRKNHISYLKSFYFSQETEEMHLKQILVNFISHQEDFSKLNFSKLQLGIPCCDCFKEFFAEF